MKKDFKKWHDKKAKIENMKPRLFFKEREIWMSFLGENIGSEQDGRGDEFLRPILVFKKFNNEIFWAIPLTKTDKSSKFYFPFIFHTNTKSVAILSQIRLIDSKRFKYKMGDMTPDDFNGLKKKIRQLLA